MFFAASEDDLIKDKYNLVIESARFADQNGFSSIWVPERHFIKFGHLYPNPAILQSALARETKHVRLMAGSVVAPLHDPIRITEDWAMVDNLSGGRVGISFAPGWNPDDFVFYPEKYKERHKEMYATVQTVRRLWEGGSINKLSGNGKQADVGVYPKPVQKQLPLWITCAGNPESFIKAGEQGANLLTHILDQEAQQLGEKIALYRDALSRNGFDPASREVTVMIHTFLGANALEIKEKARKPYCEYMKTNKNIFAGLAQSRGNKVNADALSDNDLDDLVNFLYDRFASTRGFIGSPDNCFTLLDELKAAGVDEVACLLDFGPNPDEILKNLPYIKILKQKYNSEPEDVVKVSDEHVSNTRTIPAIHYPVKNYGKAFNGHTEGLSAIRERCKKAIKRAELYDYLKHAGLGFASKEEAIETILIGANESLGRIAIPQDVFASPSFSTRHPAFLDTCFQLFLSALPDALHYRGHRYFPSGFKSISSFQPIPRTFWGHFQLTLGENGSSFFEGDINLLDDHGDLIATISSLQLQKVDLDAEGKNHLAPKGSTGAQHVAVSAVKKNNRRYDTILSDIKTMVSELLQIDATALDVHTTFVEMGSDSLILAALMNKVDKKYQVRITIRQLFEEVNTLSLIATYVDGQLPQEEEPASTGYEEIKSNIKPSREPIASLSMQPVNEVNQTTTPVAPQGQTFLEQIIKQQLDIMAQQLQAINGGQAMKETSTVTNAEKNDSTVNASCSLSAAKSFKANASVSKQPSKNLTASSAQPSIFPKRDLKRNDTQGYTAEQLDYLKTFITDFTNRTKKSKQRTQAYRHVLADNRASVGFRFSTKEMLYPIIGESSEGARIRDIDGNEYIDIAMGFGVNLFGHRPPFVTEAIEQQLQKGFQLGPQSDAAGEVATLVAELTGMERVSFHNSGTEAVMTALRLARTVTRRSKTIIFAGSYHGHFDGTLVVAEDTNENPQAIPMSLGIPQSMVNDIIVLEYGNFQSLEIIKARAEEIAAVLVEPVQSRKPDLQPKEFLKSLRELTARENIALIFDEMITGFRVHPGGAQAWFGISADIATYGKVIGGGLPIGVIAGKAKFMDALDGGMWNFGDDSSPQVETTFFAGTFCKHPLAIASTNAVLKEIKRQGPQLQRTLNARTTHLANSLNAFFQEHDLNIHVGHFGSLFYFSYTGNMDLFFYYLVHKGIYVWEGKTCFLSAAHTEKDVEFIISTIKETLILLLEKGYIKSRSGAAQRIPALSSNGNQNKAAEKERIPLTESQRKIWISAQLEEGGSVNNIPVLIELKGNLDVKKLEETLQTVLARHEALRTVFSDDGNYQVVNDNVEFHLPVVDVRSFKDQEIDKAVEAWQLKNVKEPFNLTAGPLFKAALLQVNSSHYFLFFVTHHIVADGWSTGIVIDEIAKIYSALVTGASVTLDSPNQFRNYIHALQSASATEVMRKQEQYWLQKYAVLPPKTQFAPDHSAPPVKTFSGRRKVMRLDASMLTDVVRAGKEHQVSKHMILMAAYFATFHRLTGQQDIVVGMPMAARLSNAFYNTVGCCANMLPVRSIIHDDISFSDILKQTKTELMLAYENQDFSYGSLIDKIEASRDLINNPLMELGFNFNPNINHPVLAGLECRLIPAAACYAENGLILHINEIDGGLVIECDYSTDLYDEARIESLLDTYSTFLRQVIAKPQLRIADIPIVSPREKEKIVTWNDTSSSYPHEPLQVLFEKQVREAPKNIAISFADKNITYEELNKAANQLAHYLKKTYAVKPDDLVGLLVDRSEWMIISILGILKSGAAYVPIDPEYPNARIQYILENASVKALIVDSDAAKENFSLDGISVISLKEEWKTISKESKKNPELVNRAKDLAYVIYTSGSTGNPKGVMIEHAGVVNRIHWMWKHYDFTSRDVIFQKTTFAFDVSVWEIFMTLCYGARMVLCEKEVIYDPERILEHIHEQGITTLHFVPSMLSLFLEAITEENKYKLKSLRHVMASGEALPLQTVKAFYKKLAVPLHNLYGPTEASVDVSYHQTAANDTVVPIGRPIDNIKLYVVDTNLRLLPAGCVGEIVISGVGLSRGYVGLPALSNEKFKESPFEPGERLYLTGDLGRWLHNGEIEYFGRKDYQVKIKGNRIELGEIENVLGSYEGINNAVVLVLENGSDRELAACFTTERQFHEIEIRSYLGSRLPSYMIPSHFVQLEAIPLTSNGKADRKALASRINYNGNRALSLPRNETEEKLLIIWKTILDRDEISITDNFFAIGGQSLKAIQVIASIHKAFGKKIELRSMFMYPTISLLGNYLEGIGAREYEKIKPAPKQRYFDLSQGQKPLWLLTQLQKGFKPYNMFKELSITGEFDAGAFEQTLRLVIERHDSLRTSFTSVDGIPKQVIHSVDELQYDVKYIHVNDQVRTREVLTNFSSELSEIVFDLGKAPLLRISVIHLNRETHIVSLVIHHIISDGWSNDILVKEIADAYSRIKNGEALHLKPLEIQYKDYSEWENKLLLSDGINIHKNYWHKKLDGKLPVLNLPLDMPRGKKAYEGAVHHFTIDRGTSTLLRDFNKKYNSTTFISLLSALNVLLYKYTGQHDITLGTTVAGRRFEELAGVIGPFINSVPLRNIIDGRASFADFVNVNKENVLEAHQHDIYPYVKLVEDLNLDYDLDRNPLFDVLMVLVQKDDIFEKVKELESMKDLRQTHGTSKLDLVFYVADDADAIDIVIVFRPDLFLEETIKKMATDLTTLIDTFLINPIIPIDDLKSTLLSPIKKVEQNAFENEASKVLSEEF